MSAYDIVGDIHGQGYRHPDRKLIFVGDFVDRGPAVSDLLANAWCTINAGDGVPVLDMTVT